MSQQQPIQLPTMAPFGSVVFAPQFLIGIDASEYTPGKAGRCIVAYLLSSQPIEMVDGDADAFKLWWDQVTGQNRIQPPPPGLNLSL